MKRFIAIASITLIMGTPALAGGKPIYKPKNGGTSASATAIAGALAVNKTSVHNANVSNVNNTNNAKNTNSVRNTNNNVNSQGQSQGQGQTQKATANNQNSVNVEGSAMAPGIGAADCTFSLSAGVVGAAGGISIPGRKCAIVREAQQIEALGGNGMAHMCTIRRVRLSQPALCGGGTSPAPAVTSQTYAAGKYAPAVSRLPIQRPSSADTGLTKCELSGNRVTIGYKRGADKATAKATCLASLGY